MPTIIALDFKAACASHRKRLKHLTDQQIADALGVKWRTWMGWKLGNYAPRSPMMKNMILYLLVNIPGDKTCRQ